jgi:hypothetical protein
MPSTTFSLATDVDQHITPRSLKGCRVHCVDLVSKHMNKKGPAKMSDHATYSGIAALSIVEALLLALNDAKVLPEREIVGILEDAAASHQNASGATEAEVALHTAVATLINRIIAGGNSVRRP